MWQGFPHYLHGAGGLWGGLPHKGRKPENKIISLSDRPPLGPDVNGFQLNFFSGEYREEKAGSNQKETRKVGGTRALMTHLFQV